MDRKRLWKRFAAVSLSLVCAMDSTASAQSPFTVEAAPTAAVPVVEAPAVPLPPPIGAVPAPVAVTPASPVAPIAIPSVALPVGAAPVAVAPAPPLPTSPTTAPAAAVTTSTPSTTATPVATAPAQSPPAALVNSTHVSLNCRIDKVGPSGIAKVGVWVTGDGGLTWQRLNDATFRQNALDINLPGEGLFGVRPVAVNGNGFGGAAPAPGQAPAFWVEVDTTAPVVQLGNIQPSAEGGVLNLSWNAQDKNFGQGPVSLQYRTHPQGAWKQIAANLNAQGSARWQIPRDQGAQFFFRAVAIDRCGNVSQSETLQPFQLDLTEPELVIVGAAGVERRVTPAGVVPTAGAPTGPVPVTAPMVQQVPYTRGGDVAPGGAEAPNELTPVSNESPVLPTPDSQ